MCIFLWAFKYDSLLNRRGHNSHLRVFSRCDILWPLNETSFLNAFPQTSHLKPFTSECKNLCLCKVPLFAYFLGHSVHLKGLGSSFNNFSSRIRIRSFCDNIPSAWLKMDMLFSMWFDCYWQELFIINSFQFHIVRPWTRWDGIELELLCAYGVATALREGWLRQIGWIFGKV